MKFLVFVLIFTFSLATQADTSKAAAQFCKNLRSYGDRYPTQSLRQIRMALKLKSGLGPYAKNSTPLFEKAGFNNLLEKDRKILKTPEEIPDGAIFVLVKSPESRGCPVNSKWGHVAVKCGSDELFWPPKGKRRLSDFVKANRKCIESVVYNTKWDQEAESQEPVSSKKESIR